MNIPQLLRERPQWLLWKFEAQQHDKKPRKVPYYIGGGRRHGDQGSDNDRRQLAAFDVAYAIATRGRYEGLGFAFLPGDNLIGIDLDAVVDDDGVFSELARDIIKRCDSYTEFSPSKKGVHIFVAGDSKQLLADKLADSKTGSFKNNAIGVEVFCGAQFFTWTGEQLSGTPAEIAPISRETLLMLYETVRAKPKEAPAPAGPAPRPSQAVDEYRRCEAALAYIDAEDYHQWILIGHALKAGLGNAGLSLWDRWSSKSSKYAGTAETAKRWLTFDPQRVTLGSVFELAKQSGYQPPPRAPKGAKRAEAPSSSSSAPGHGEEPPPPDGPPPGFDDGDDDGHVIRIRPGELELIVDQAEAAIMRSPTRIYQRAGSLVRVVRRHVRTVRNYSGRTDTLGFHNVEQPFLVEKFTAAARWEKWNGRDKKWQRTNCPDSIAAMYLARSGHWILPKLWSVITAPTLRPDGTLLQDAGYDEATGTLYDPCGVDFPRVPDQATREDAERALERLVDAFKTVPFTTGIDRSVMIATVLTGLIRRSLPAAPLIGITAPIMSAGKTLLADAASIIAMGTPAPAMKFPETDEEAAKSALAFLAAGDPFVLLDNVERPLQGDWLCTILTSETYRQRVLGRTEMMDVPTTSLFLATGNHLVIAGDLRTRALMCRIDPKSEHPEQRQFDYDLREFVASKRAELVAAGLTIMRAFIATGELKHVRDHVKPWGRFERWSEMVRAPLVWLGLDDPCGSIASLEKDDPERNELLRMLHAWYGRFGEEPTSAREVVDDVRQGQSMGATTEQKALGDILGDIGRDRGGDLSPRKIAKWLQRHVGRRVNGRQFIKADERDHVALWKVEVIPAG
jgi:putative DNA primase/helicase